MNAGLLQLPALISPGITLVISPLVSLIQDQIMHLLQVTIPTVVITVFGFDVFSVNYILFLAILVKMQCLFLAILYCRSTFLLLILVPTWNGLSNRKFLENLIQVFANTNFYMSHRKKLLSECWLFLLN